MHALLGHTTQERVNLFVSDISLTDTSSANPLRDRIAGAADSETT